MSFKRAIALLPFVFIMASPLLAQREVQKPVGKTEYAIIETKFGTIEIELFRTLAPKTVENFVQLAKKGYYNGVRFHRIAKGFVIQGGDPTGTGAGGESIYGKTFEDEITREHQIYKQGYKRGIVAMANTGQPNTNGSQFFVCLSDINLPPSYTIFGIMRKGFETLDRIAELEITPVFSPTDGKPKQDVVMTKVRVKAKP